MATARRNAERAVAGAAARAIADHAENCNGNGNGKSKFTAEDAEDAKDCRTGHHCAKRL